VIRLNTETGETGQQKLAQASDDAERFYRELPGPSLIVMEATGNSHWLVDLLAEIGHELRVGDAAQIRASYVRQQKTDKRDAAHILKLLVEGRFPRVWVPSSEVRDLRQLLLHRYKLVTIRRLVKNELQAFDLLLIEAITADYKYLLLCTSQLRDQRLKATPFRNH
jgi:transposase